MRCGASTELGDGLGQEAVLLNVDFFGEACERVVGFDADRCLGDDGAPVDFGGDFMHGASGDFDAAPPGLADCVEPRETGEQAGMEVDDFSAECGEERGLDHAHESGEHDEVRVQVADELDVALLGGAFEFGFEGGGIEVSGWDAKARPEGQDAGGWLV